MNRISNLHNAVARVLVQPINHIWLDYPGNIMQWHWQTPLNADPKILGYR